MDTKTCIKCGEIKTIDLFRTKRNQCKNCCKEIYREYYKNNPDICTKYRRENYGYASLQSKKYVEKHPEKKSLLRKKHISNLHDWYIKDLLKLTGFKPEQITPELIELKRITIKTERLCKQLKV